MTPNTLELLAGFSVELIRQLEELAGFGADLDGGVTRLLYTDAWLQAQQAVARRMQELGLEVRFDAVGNLYGSLPGMAANTRPIVTGSHIDTVACGGKYDGAYGVVAGMLALGFLKAAYGLPKRTLEAVSFCEEEGSRFPLTFWGSGSVTGVRTLEQAAGVADHEGISLQDAMQRAGFGSAEGAAARRKDIGAYIELHIEQGGVLEHHRKQIGIVTAIVGQIRLGVRVLGVANHAGTTPMQLRKDALAGAAEMIALTERQALAAGEPLVATVGKIEVSQGASNVVPGDVAFTLDIRHTDEPALNAFYMKLQNELAAVANRRELEIEITEHLHVIPVQMDSAISNEVERICEDARRPYLRLPSGAGHDAQLLGAVCRAAMIFVPSRAGISHNPTEYTSAEELVAGFQTLVHLLYQYGYGGKADDDL